MTDEIISASNLISLLIQAQEEALARIKNGGDTEQLRLALLGSKSDLSRLTRQITLVPKEERAKIGPVVSEVKLSIENALNTLRINLHENIKVSEYIDVTAPGIRPPEGHLHIVTQAITEITRIFERIGFTRVRHPEVDWDYYAFEALNMPADHPARDEWETFFIDSSVSFRPPSRNPVRTGIPKQVRDDIAKIVLTPHTSNGQVREMEKGKLPIRMINIAKCYRRQIDVSHTPMFHQFEGMYIDKGVSIAHLKGVFDYFVKQFYGPDRKIRLRPFHFQFTEPSFEVDINCGICLGKGCRLCKEGWLEMAGSGMVHPNVLRAGGVDPNIYSGFAFGWGVERAYMMKNNTKIDDIRLIYSNDIRFLQQF